MPIEKDPNLCRDGVDRTKNEENEAALIEELEKEVQKKESRTEQIQINGKEAVLEIKNDYLYHSNKKAQIEKTVFRIRQDGLVAAGLTREQAIQRFEQKKFGAYPYYDELSMLGEDTDNVKPGKSNSERMGFLKKYFGKK